jgi:drug/metabolite transporter (DMT)-like permease
MPKNFLQEDDQFIMFYLFLGALIISFAPILVKIIDFGPTWSAAWRLIIASIALCALLFVQNRRNPQSQTLWTRAKGSLIFLFLAGLLFALDLFFWHRCIKYIGAGVATLLGNTQVLYLTAWTFILLKKRPDKLFIGALLLSFLGLGLLISVRVEQPQPHYWRGIIYGLFTGFTYAMFLLCFRKAAEKANQTTSLERLFIFSVVGGFFLTTVATFSDPMPVWKISDVIYLILLGTFVHIGGWHLIGTNLPKVSHAKAGLILLTQPVLATLLSCLFLGESLSFLQVIGMLLALTGIYLGSLVKI